MTGHHPASAPWRLALSALALLIACNAADGGVDDGGPPVQRNPEVTNEERHDTSRPVREIPPQPHPPGHRVHEVKRIPRPPPEAPDAGPTE